MFNERTYAFGTSTLTLRFDDILDSNAQVLVSSDDFMLTMGGGVSRAIAQAAGNAVKLDAAKSAPRRLGDVVVTTAGALDARYIFHVITIGSPEDRSVPNVGEIVRRATARCLDLLELLDVDSVSFPALGTGAAGFSMEAAATAMADVVADHLLRCKRKLQVSLYFRSRWGGGDERPYIAFFEEFARRRPEIANQSTPPVDVPARPVASESLSHLLELERERLRLEQDIVMLKAKKESATTEGLSQRLIANQSERLDVAAREWAYGDRPISLFISYAHEDSEYREKLSKHLSNLKDQGLIETWHDRLISPGSDWDSEINRAMNEADVVIFLVSSDFISSGYIRGVEVARTFERLGSGEIRLLPVLVRTVDLAGSRLSSLQWLPTGGKPINRWDDEDEAYFDVVTGIRQACLARRMHID